MNNSAEPGLQVAVSAAVLALRAELRDGMRLVATLSLGVRTVEVFTGRDSVWAVIRSASGRSGGLALRLAHC